jgi:hypothetical protein
MDQNFVLLSFKERSLGIKQGEMAFDAIVVMRFGNGQGNIAVDDSAILRLERNRPP